MYKEALLLSNYVLKKPERDRLTFLHLIPLQSTSTFYGFRLTIFKVILNDEVLSVNQVQIFIVLVNMIQLSV